jgi:hypothetical protein
MRIAVIAGAATLIILAGGIAVLVVGLRRRARPAPVSRDRQYLELLDLAKKETLADRKLFYSRLYRLLVQYLEREKKLNLTGKTGEEVVEIVKGQTDWPPMPTMVAWLELTQAVKYRPDPPAPADLEDIYGAVKRFLESNAATS